MAKFKINKAKLIKNDHLSLSYRITEDDKTEATSNLEHERPAHADLKAAFKELAPHLAILTGCIRPKQAADEDLIKDFTVTGISLKGEEGFVITGYRSLENGTVTLNTPFTRYEGENVYQLIKQVETTLQKCKEEILLYIVNGKRAPEPQPELPFLKEDNVTHAVIAEPEEKKKPLFKDDSNDPQVDVPIKKNARKNNKPEPQSASNPGGKKKNKNAA